MVENKTFTEKTIDRSNNNAFSFGFLCDCCGKEWISPVKSFSNLDGSEQLWADGHRVAFEEAVSEARLYFNKCPKCGKWVCDDCFVPEKDTCRKCNRLVQ